jgi:hypothetical protein
MTKSRWLLAFTSVIVALSSSCLGFAGSAFNFTELTHTFQPAPVPARTSFVYPYSSNDHKQVAFVGDGALFLKSPGHIAPLVGLGMSAPGGGKFLEASTPSINNHGEIVFRGDTLAPSSSGLFLYSNGTITQVVRDGDQSASGDTVFPTSPSLNNNGTVAFLSFTGNGLFVRSQGVISRVAAPGDIAPGGDTFIDFQSCSINQSGEIVFSAFLLSGNTGIYLASGGTITKIAASGDSFPDGGMIFTFLGAPSLNDTGQVVVAGLANGPVHDSGVYLFSNGSLTVPVPNSTPIPGGGILTLITEASLNNASQIAFVSQTSNVQGAGAFLFSGGSITQAMTPGQPSPGGDTFTSCFEISVDAAGRVLFNSRLKKHANALFRFNGTNLVRLTKPGDPVASQPAFTFPFAFGLSSDRVLVFASTSPGGTGLFNVSKGNANDVELVAKRGERFEKEGVIEGFFENFETNSNGDTVFNSNLSRGRSIIFHKAPGRKLDAIVHAAFDGSGDIAPDGSRFLGVRWVSINNVSQVGFAAFTPTQSGIYLSDSGLISLAVDANSPLPDGSGTFGTLSLNALNDHHQIAFLAQSFPVPNGIYLLSEEQFATVARDGASAPGGGEYSLGFPDPAFGPSLNNNGDVAFAADLSTGGRAIFLWSVGIVTRIIGPGDSVPGGGTFVSADSPRLNSGGQLAFFGRTDDGRFGAFLFSGGAITKIAASGDPAPRNLSFTFVNSPVINDAGEVAFGADLSDGTVSTFAGVPASPDRAGKSALGTRTASPRPTRRVPEQVLRAKHPRPLLHRTR